MDFDEDYFNPDHNNIPRTDATNINATDSLESMSTAKAPTIKPSTGNSPPVPSPFDPMDFEEVFHEEYLRHNPPQMTPSIKPEPVADQQLEQMPLDEIIRQTRADSEKAKSNKTKYSRAKTRHPKSIASRSFSGSENRPSSRRARATEHSRSLGHVANFGKLAETYKQPRKVQHLVKAHDRHPGMGRRPAPPFQPSPRAPEPPRARNGYEQKTLEIVQHNTNDIERVHNYTSLLANSVAQCHGETEEFLIGHSVLHTNSNSALSRKRPAPNSKNLIAKRPYQPTRFQETWQAISDLNHQFASMIYVMDKVVVKGLPIDNSDVQAIHDAKQAYNSLTDRITACCQAQAIFEGRHQSRHRKDCMCIGCKTMKTIEPEIMENLEPTRGPQAIHAPLEEQQEDENMPQQQHINEPQREEPAAPAPEAPAMDAVPKAIVPPQLQSNSPPQLVRKQFTNTHSGPMLLTTPRTMPVPQQTTKKPFPSASFASVHTEPKPPTIQVPSTPPQAPAPTQGQQPTTPAQDQQAVQAPVQQVAQVQAQQRITIGGREYYCPAFATVNGNAQENIMRDNLIRAHHKIMLLFRRGGPQWMNLANIIADPMERLFPRNYLEAHVSSLEWKAYAETWGKIKKLIFTFEGPYAMSNPRYMIRGTWRNEMDDNGNVLFIESNGETLMMPQEYNPDAHFVYNRGYGDNMYHIYGYQQINAIPGFVSWATEERQLPQNLVDPYYPPMEELFGTEGYRYMPRVHRTLGRIQYAMSCSTSGATENDITRCQSYRCSLCSGAHLESICPEYIWPLEKQAEFYRAKVCMRCCREHKESDIYEQTKTIEEGQPIPDKPIGCTSTRTCKFCRGPHSEGVCVSDESYRFSVLMDIVYKNRAIARTQQHLTEMRARIQVYNAQAHDLEQFRRKHRTTGYRLVNAIGNSAAPIQLICQEYRRAKELWEQHQGEPILHSDWMEHLHNGRMPQLYGPPINFQRPRRPAGSEETTNWSWLTTTIWKLLIHLL